MKYAGRRTQASQYSERLEWNNVIIRDGSRFCETWSLYNLWGSLRKRIQNYKYKVRYESDHCFRMRKEMPTKHWRCRDSCMSIFSDLFRKFTSIITLPRTFYNLQNSQGPVQVEGTEAGTLLLHSPLVLIVKLQAIGSRWWDHFSRQAVLPNFLESIPNRILTECYKGINKVQYYGSTMVLQRKEPKWSLRERCEGLGRFLELGP